MPVAAYRTYHKSKLWTEPEKPEVGQTVKMRFVKVSPYRNLIVRADVSLLTKRVDLDTGEHGPWVTAWTKRRGFRPNVRAGYNDTHIFDEPGRYITKVKTVQAGEEPTILHHGRSIEVSAEGTIDVIAWPDFEQWDDQRMSLSVGDTITQRFIVKNRDPNTAAKIVGVILTATSGLRTDHPADHHTHDFSADLNIIYRPKATTPPAIDPATGLFQGGYVDTLGPNGGQCAYIVTFKPPTGGHGQCTIRADVILEGDHQISNERREDSVTDYTLTE